MYALLCVHKQNTNSLDLAESSGVLLFGFGFFFCIQPLSTNRLWRSLSIMFKVKSNFKNPNNLSLTFKKIQIPFLFIHNSDSSCTLSECSAIIYNGLLAFIFGGKKNLFHFLPSLLMWYGIIFMLGLRWFWSVWKSWRNQYMNKPSS